MRDIDIMLMTWIELFNINNCSSSQTWFFFTVIITIFIKMTFYSSTCFSIYFTLWSSCELLNTAGVLLSFLLSFPLAEQYYWTPVRKAMITLTWHCKIHYTAFILNTRRHTCNSFRGWFIMKDFIFKTFTQMILVSLTKWANWECLIRAINTTLCDWLQQQGLTMFHLG